jgi:hypothetical protein
MPDISMCSTRGCSIRGICYRYRAVPNGRRQSYMSPPAPSDGVSCEHFEAVVESDKLVRTHEVDRQWDAASNVH